MILYRDMTYKEYNKILNNKEFPRYDKKTIVDNSFTYGDSEARMHMFKNIEYAKMYLYCFGEMIVKCNIPDNLIEESGYGYYGYKRYPIYVPIPEYTVKRSDFSTDYIEEINPSMRKNYNYILGVREIKLYNMLLKKLYKEWIMRDSSGTSNYGFCNYVINYLQSKNLDDVLRWTAGEYLEKTGKIKVKKK